MITVRARVLNGRLVVDEPIDLPDGTELELVAEEESDKTKIATLLRNSAAAEDRLTDEDARELRTIRERGEFTSHDDMKRKLAARKT